MRVNGCHQDIKRQTALTPNEYTYEGRRMILFHKCMKQICALLLGGKMTMVRGIEICDCGDMIFVILKS